VTTPLYQSTDYTPAAGHPAALTFPAGAPIAGGQLLMVNAAGEAVPTTVAGAAEYIGVAGGDGTLLVPGALGGDVTVLCGSGVIHETPSVAPIAAMSPVSAGAAGGIVGTANATIGVCVRASDPAADPPVPCRWLAFR
jgi:hypothetical protein